MADVLNVATKADTAIALQSETKADSNQPSGAMQDFAASLYNKSNKQAFNEASATGVSDAGMKKAGDSWLVPGKETGVTQIGDSTELEGTAGGACVSDGQGYIVCGPIVGYPPPEATPKSNKEIEVPKSPPRPPEMNPMWERLEILDKNKN